MSDLATPALSSRGRTIAYWIATVIIVFVLGAGGVGDIMRPPAVVEGMAHLGYPIYVCVLLGVWKVLGALAIVAPRFPRLKEWAYAGTIFDLTGATVSHLSSGDSVGKASIPLLFAAVALASWALRPASRRL